MACCTPCCRLLRALLSLSPVPGQLLFNADIWLHLCWTGNSCRVDVQSHMPDLQLILWPSTALSLEKAAGSLLHDLKASCLNADKRASYESWLVMRWRWLLGEHGGQPFDFGSILAGRLVQSGW